MLLTSIWPILMPAPPLCPLAITSGRRAMAVGAAVISRAGSGHLAASDSKLPRFGGIVDRETLRQNLPGFILEKSESLIERDLRRNDALYAHRIQLLKLLQLSRFGGCLQAGERGQRYQLVFRSRDV